MKEFELISCFFFDIKESFYLKKVSMTFFTVLRLHIDSFEFGCILSSHFDEVPIV